MYDPLQNVSLNVVQLASRIRLLVLDVDGVLTDGQVIYTDSDHETKSFNIKDGLGIKWLQKTGVTVAIITGRVSAVVERRARELGISLVVQGREDKLQALKDLIRDQAFTMEQIAYMGDDLPDLSAIKASGFGITVADANPLISEHADFQTTLPGGRGAVREIADIILAAQKQYLNIISDYL